MADDLCFTEVKHINDHTTQKNHTYRSAGVEVLSGAGNADVGVSTVSSECRCSVSSLGDSVATCFRFLIIIIWSTASITRSRVAMSTAF